MHGFALWRWRWWGGWPLRAAGHWSHTGHRFLSRSIGFARAGGGKLAWMSNNRYLLFGLANKNLSFTDSSFSKHMLRLYTVWLSSGSCFWKCDPWKSETVVLWPTIGSLQLKKIKNVNKRWTNFYSNYPYSKHIAFVTVVGSIDILRSWSVYHLMSRG